MNITILTHERDQPISAYTLGKLSEHWQANGHSVQVARGVSRPLSGDMVILHVDLTVVPDEYRRAVERHPCVLNRGLVDISKPLFCRIQVRSPEEWNGPVIVKTVLNHGGYLERRMRRRTVLGRARNLVSRLGLVPLARAETINPYRYPVFDTARDVPRGAYRNPRLIVERFLPERCDGLYFVRVCRCLGARNICERFSSTERITRVAHTVLPEVVPMHPKMESVRREIGMDYGKLDYVIHEGEPVLLDVARTPAISANPERVARHLAALAEAIDHVDPLTGWSG